MSDALDVALDVTAVPRALTGAGVYTLELARALLASGALDLALYCRRDDAERWQELGVVAPRALAPRSRAARVLWGELAFGAALRRDPALSLLHAPHYTMPLRPGLPVVVTVHDLTLLEHPEWHERSKVLLFTRALRRAARRADRLICVSAHTARRLGELLEPRAPVEVIPHGVDHRRFSAVEPRPGHDARCLAPLALPERYLLHLGTLEPRKNLVALVTAFDRLAAREPELGLVLAGAPGWGSAPLQAAIAAARHRSRIVVTGYLDAALVPALLRRASVVAYPSFEEGFGLPALEALATGAPLVTTAGSAMAELAGDVAWYFEVDEADSLEAALAEALASGGARRALGVARAATFTWEASAARHLEAYAATRR